MDAAGGSVVAGGGESSRRGNHAEKVAVVGVRIKMHSIFSNPNDDEGWNEVSRRCTFLGVKMTAEVCRDEIGELLRNHSQAKTLAGVPLSQEGDMDGLLEDLTEIEASLLRAAPPPEPTQAQAAATPAPVEEFVPPQHAVPPQGRWTKTAANALVLVRFEMNGQWQEASTGRWDRVSERLRRIGFHKTALECREKWHDLKGYYSKLARTAGDKGSSTWSQFNVLEAFELLAPPPERSTKRLKSHHSNI